ncbi:hypothetical protein [Paractinoplanes durhamensis]|uniref:Uncharacterized protein n=1 Tax=Paractinoplanes durhamensis TaxID=113563 RepID=A0ABQ3YXE8_9ACTN|nr:hypothetical protein [Actinoplanes durhamensis]GIE02226.1 hypothetical protein Adu01nite_35760 [Actinoplanes durhamensis]
MARVLRLLLAAAISVVALVGAVRLIAPPDHTSSVRRQLTFLRSALEDGAASQAQAQFPEGYFFLYALYGLSHVDIGDLDAARWALSRIDSAEGREPFDAGLTPAYGVFYRGWLNWLRGGILLHEPAATRDPAETAAFERDSADLAAAFDASPTPFLAAYPGQAWPVDSTVAVASLALHDKLVTPAYGPTIERWLSGVRVNLDPATGLMPHTADVDTGLPTAGARGTSQSIIQRFLPEIDPEFGRAQYLRFRDTFLARPLGLGPAVREYPRGTDGPADVDSGPLPLGISLSATVVTVGAAKVQGDEPLADALANFGEVLGVPIDTWHTRRYAFGLVPIGDAFLAWSKSARPWVATAPAAPPATISGWWRLPLLTFFLLMGTGPWLVRAGWRRNRSRRSKIAFRI